MPQSNMAIHQLAGAPMGVTNCPGSWAGSSAPRGATAMLTSASVVITLLISIPVAYGLARLARNRRGERIGIGIFLVYLIPTTLLFIPMCLGSSSISASRNLSGR